MPTSTTPAPLTAQQRDQFKQWAAMCRAEFRCGQGYVRVGALALAELLESASAELARLTAFARFARHELHEAGLIDNHEYAALLNLPANDGE